ncbi:thioredoxin [bacterium]|nr:MAG: thioredoxin [bacterium]
MSDNIIEVTDDNFKETISEGIVLVDFWAEWCGPCKALVPTLEELASKNEDIKVVKVNVEKCPDTATSFKIRSIPTLIFFKDGEEGRLMVGSQSITYLQQEVDALRGSNG